MKKEIKEPLEIIKEYVIMLVCFGVGIVLFMVSNSGESSSDFSVLFIAFAGLYLIKAVQTKTFDYLQDYLEYHFPKHKLVHLLTGIPMVFVFVFVVIALWKGIVVNYLLPIGTVFFMFAILLPVIKQLKHKNE